MRQTTRETDNPASTRTGCVVGCLRGVGGGVRACGDCMYGGECKARQRQGKARRGAVR